MSDPGSAPASTPAPASDPRTPPRPPRKVYVRHGPPVWARARALYLDGRTAGQVAAELGCSIAAVRQQASRGGWTRRDAAAGEACGAREAQVEAACGGAPAVPHPGAAPLGEGRFDPPLSPSAQADGGPSHLRLAPEAWEVIRGERLAGASIAKLAARWKVSEGTLRRHARDEGWSNTDRGAAVSRAMVEAKLVEDAFAEGRAAAAREAAAEAEAASGAAAGEAGEAAEADPLEAARTLLRRAAAAAVAGRLAEAGAGVKLAEGLARAAGALGLDAAEGEAGDGWEEPDEPRLSPEALEALRDDVRRRYARFDRPEAEDAPAAAAAPAGEGVGEVEAQAVAAPAAEAAAPVSRAGGEGRAAPRPAGWTEAEATETRGISRPSRAISVSPWPAWAGPPDGWARSVRGW